MWTSYSTSFARDAKNRYLRWLPPDLYEKTSGIRIGGTTSREIPAELCTFELSGTVGCASKPRNWPPWLLSSEGAAR
jgi:hypothetical protein